MVLERGLLSGTKIALVVGVHSVGDGFESTRLALALEHGEEFVFAVITAPRIVADVSGIFQFPRLHNFDGNLVFARKSERVFEMSAGQARGIGNHGQHLAAKHFVRRPG